MGLLFCSWLSILESYATNNMYQLEVKQQLIHHLFHPNDGWEVFVAVDAMEVAKGGQHPADKKKKVEAVEKKLKELGVEINEHKKAEAALRKLKVKISAHKQNKRVDIAAIHPEREIHLIEVEGQSSKQPEQAMYSVLGQTILLMNSANTEKGVTYGLAFPDQAKWELQVQKIPERVKKLLKLKCFLVSSKGVREI